MFTDNKNVQIKLYEIFGKTEQSVNEDVQKIKKWMKNQHHFPEIMSDRKIRNFLNLSKFDLEKTKERIDAYYTMRSKHPQILGDCNPKLPHMIQTREIMYVCSHPKLIDDLHRVTFIKMKEKNTCNPQNAMKILFNVFEIRLQNDVMVDDVFIMDMENITFMDLTKITPALLYRVISIYKNVFALRLKTCYFLNSPPYITFVLKLLKLFLKPKLYERIQVYQDTEGLKDVFSTGILPKNYGGNGPSLDELNEIMKEEFEKCQERFDELDKLKVNESLRPKKSM